MKTLHKFPFTTKLSFVPLIDYLKGVSISKNHAQAAFAKMILEEVNKVPEFLAPIDDDTILHKNKAIVDLLMSAIFPPAFQETIHATANLLFQPVFFYKTKAFDELIPNYKVEFNLRGKNNIDILDIQNLDTHLQSLGNFSIAYTKILNKFYKTNLQPEVPFLNKLTHNNTGLIEWILPSINSRFVDIKLVGELKKLSKEDINLLINNAQDFDLWMKILPPENFVFHGFIQIIYNSVTEKEILSSLKSDLLEKESLTNIERFNELQTKIRSLLKLTDIKLGLASFTSNLKTVNHKLKIWNSILLRCNDVCKNFENSEFYKVIKDKKPIIISDLTDFPNKSVIEEEILKQGILSLAIIPLSYDNEFVGVLELGSPNKNDINSMMINKLYEVFPIFSIALKRASEELNNKIQATIKEECTAIHPSVEWRFIEAAANLLEKQEKNETAVMEEIIFKDVYPLYGATDIRSSSTERNNAIQADIIEHLNLAIDVLNEANKLSKMPIIDQLLLKINKNIKNVKKSLNSGDEDVIIDFIKTEIEPIISHFHIKYKSLNDIISKYKNSINPEIGIVYKRRKDFEESLMMINDAVSAFIDKEEDKAQIMFPHYFEKYKTDGIEYNIYIGASLMQDQKFCQIYLENIRLWQLIIMCQITKLTAELKPKLKIHLDTTQLVLIHSSPLAIRFRLDEKQFDVDGAYNIRYEIVKKRIDKSNIKGTKERLTQPGKIAIIYSQTREQKEYERFIEYLIDKEFITDKVEYLELEDLQGATGLKAMRIEVKI